MHRRPFEGRHLVSTFDMRATSMFEVNILACGISFEDKLNIFQKFHLNPLPLKVANL